MTKLLTISDYKDCWYVPGEGHIQDLIHPVTGLTLHYKKSAAQMLEEFPAAVRLPFEEAWRRIEEGTKQDVSEIDEERYMYALNVLPPVGWRTSCGVESFKISERITGALTNIYAQCGDRYFHLVDDIRLSADDIATRVGKFLAANPRAKA